MNFNKIISKWFEFKLHAPIDRLDLKSAIEQGYKVEFRVVKPFTEIPNMDKYLNLEEIQKLFKESFDDRVFDIRFERELDKPRDINLKVVDKYGDIPFLIVLKYKNKLMWVRLRIDYLFNVPPRKEENGGETKYTGAKFAGAYEDDVYQAITDLRLAVIKTFGTIPTYEDVLKEKYGDLSWLEPIEYIG